MLDILELNNKKLVELRQIAKDLGIRRVESFKKQDLIYRILDEQAIQESERKKKPENSKKNEEAAKNEKRPRRGRPPKKVAEGRNADQNQPEVKREEPKKEEPKGKMLKGKMSKRLLSNTGMKNLKNPMKSKSRLLRKRRLNMPDLLIRKVK